jgi:hypothetical protein
MGFLLNFFLNPLFLAATATAGVPVVIHLIHRRQAPRVLFSTLRFLRLSVDRTARRRRIQDLLLLILRSLLFFLLAFALAKPFFRGGSPFGGQVATSIAIVVDNSASMGVVERGERRFARAKEVARALLGDNLRSGRDACCLLFTNGPEALVEPALESALQKVDARINESDLSVGFADLASAVERAADVLAAGAFANRELYVITDLQAASWKGLQRDSRLAAHPDIPLVVIDCGHPGYENLAVTDVRIEGEGQVVEIPVSIRASLFNGSDRPVARFVSLYVDRTKVGNTPEAVTVPPNGTVEVAFQHTFHAAGRYAGWVRIDNDSLDLDNQRHFTVAVVDRLPVLLLRDEAAPVAFHDEAYFLAAALNPYSLLDTTRRGAIDPKTETLERVTPEVLRPYSAVFLLNGRQVTPALAQALADYVARGGGLAVGLGDDVSPEVYNQVFGAITLGGKPVPGGLLPARLSTRAGGADDRQPAPHPEHADLQHYLLRPFAKHPSLYQRIVVNSYVRVAQPLSASTATLMVLEGGAPLILERAFGDGRVVLLTTTFNDAWTNMPPSTFYAPFVQRLVFYLAGRASERGRSYTAGTPVRVPFPGVAEPTALDVTMPNDEVVQVKTAAGDAGQEARFGRTFEPGIYAYQSPQHQSVQGAFAVNPDPAEADLVPIDWKTLSARIPLRRAYCVRDLSELRERIISMRRGVQLWNLFFFAALLLAVFEVFLANRLRPSSADPPRRM